MSRVIALVGRPNVGKSTLFNRLTRSRDALVADFPGLTRDRQYGLARLEDGPCIVIDTGGLSGEEAGIDEAMAKQTLQAVEEADLVVFMVDARSGLSAGDTLIADRLRRMGRDALLVLNKVDGVGDDAALAEFAELGFPDTFPVSAAHGRGMRGLLAAIAERLPGEAEDADAAMIRGIAIGVVGRPNVGKSTLVNRMLGEDRVVVYDEAGTTRDSIYIPYDRDGEPFTLIDTAGVRRRGRIGEAVEKFSVVKTLEAIDRASVVVLVVDAREGLVEQDLHLLGTVLEHGRAIVLAVNKWDGLAPDVRDRVRRELDRKLDFAPWMRVHFISALHGSGVGGLYDAVREADAAASVDLPTPKLTAALETAVREHSPPLRHGRRIKLRYAHQGGSRPPVIVVHGTQTEHLPAAYRRFLENRFRQVFGLVGTPIRVELKSGANPYAGRRNKLTPRQEKKRKRLMRHVKKRSR
ncbi:MAG: ribosome biogenesis GTPase Der [Pseudomonadales bacterium]|nr:ribosome biogenesis GTPase Der [Pseudomonadales bacterium]